MKDRSCKRFSPMASAYLDRELDPRESESYRNHLFDCADCRRHLSETRRVSLALRSGPTVELPRELRGYVMTAVRRSAAHETSVYSRVIDWMLTLNPRPLSYAAGSVVAAMMLLLVVPALKPIPVTGRGVPLGTVVPVVTGSLPQFESYNGLPTSATGTGSPAYYELPRLLDNSPLVSFSHIAYQKPGHQGTSVMLEVSPDGRGHLVDVLDESTDPFLVEQLWWSVSQRAFRPATVGGRPVSTRIIMLVEKVDVTG